jgi:colanic acid/amylovoran biosynthesis glycosyltransferase
VCYRRGVVKVAYLIPEFPGQTHTWMWREIVWMRRWGVEVNMFSTRRPGERDRARHAFAEAAARETTYLWPPQPGVLLLGIAWAAFTRPLGLARCLGLALTLPVQRRADVLALLPAGVLLARQLQVRGLTHVHIHSCAGSAILGMLAKRLIGSSFSLTLNANIEWWGGAMAEKFSDAAFTMAITQWLLAQMKRDFPQLRPEQAQLGRIGVDTDKWRPLAAVGAAPAGAARLVSVGRLHASKGYDVLLAAVKQLVDAGRALSLTIIGAGPERAALEAQARGAGLDRQVAFAGSLSEDEIVDRMRQADLFVLASHAEPLGVVYMEAMSMGLPTIGTSAGGVGEIITHDVDGLLVPPGDAPALAQAIVRLLDDPALRARLGAAGRATIERRFDARIGAQALYERLFGQAPPARAPAAAAAE